MKFLTFINRYFSSKRKHLHYVVQGNILQRKWPYNTPNIEWAKGKYPGYAEKYDTWEEVPNLNGKRKYRLSTLINVILKADITGLGGENSVVKVHKSRFYRYLFPLQLGEMATPERISMLPKSKKQVLVGRLYATFLKLQNLVLPIPMNHQTKWTLTPKHVHLAFRKFGVNIENEAQIDLPDFPITNENAHDSFSVFVNINNIEKAEVTCKIYFFQRIDQNTITHPHLDYKENLKITDWSAPLKYIPTKHDVFCETEKSQTI